MPTKRLVDDLFGGVTSIQVALALRGNRGNTPIVGAFPNIGYALRWIYDMTDNLCLHDYMRDRMVPGTYNFGSWTIGVQPYDGRLPEIR